MSDTEPDVETITDQIRSSDRFQELVEEMAAHYRDSAHKDERLPEILGRFREDAREAGLSDDEAQTVADRVKGQLMGQAREQAPPEPAERLPSGDGPIPEARYEELPGPLVRLLRLIDTEEKPLREALRLIDAVEWAVKWHTTLALSDLLSETGLPAEVKVLLAHGLQTPSLGLWNQFFRKALKALEDPSLPWEAWERLTKLEDKHELVSFRNEYAHGGTPPPEECRSHVDTYLPVLKEMIHTPIFTDVGLAIRGEGAEPQLLRGSERQALGIELEEGHAAALLPNLDLNGEAPGETPWTERARLDLWPLGLTATASVEDAGGSEDEERPQFFYFNALKNEAVERLNYEEALLDRVPGLYDPFHERLPLRKWKKAEGPDLERFRSRIETLTEDFVGRRKERERLRTFAAEGDGNLMVFGAPGIGKSALLAQVKREIEAGVDLDGRDLSEEMPPVIEYFIRSGESDDATELLRHLCRRLDRRYGLSGHGLGSEPVDLSEQLRARLQAIEDQAREDGESPERTLLLVDGLDEGPELGRYIPESRSWLPVLVASRETEEARSFYENREIQARQETTVGPLSAADVRALLYKVISKYDPGLTEEYVQAVAERSEGNPLYLQLLAEQLFQGELDVGDIEALPEKVGELYEDTVQRVTDGGENRMAEDVLLLLAEAREPLSAGAMAGLLDERGSRVRSGLRAAMELLQRQDGGPEEPDRYQLFHETLREWLRDPDGMHAKGCDEMNEQMAERCLAWTERREDGARGYALRHAAAHLKAAGRDGDLYELLTDEDYQDAQVRATGQFDATYRAYEHGLEAYVERDGETPEDDARLCRLALDAGKAAREAKEGVTQAFRWAEDGRMEDALQRTEVLGQEKFFLAALRLLWIEADRQAEKPEEERSEEKAEKVLDAVEERIAPGTESIDWSEFTLSTGSWFKDFMAWWAVRVLTVFPSINVTSLLLRTSRNHLNDLTSALAEHIKTADNDVNPRVLGKSACRIARHIENGFHQTVALTDVALALGEADESNRAKKTLEEALTLDGPMRAGALAHVADTLADCGDFGWALDVAQAIEPDGERAEALSNIASALADSGDFERALAIAQAIDSSPDRARALSHVASTLVDADDSGRAKKVSEQALEAARGIDSNSERAEALSYVTSALSDTGDSERAKRVFEQALDAAKETGSGLEDLGAYNRAEAFSNVASILADDGNFDWALDVAQEIDRNRPHSEALVNIISRLADSGNFERALDVTESIDPGDRRAEALSNIASTLADSGDFNRALDFAQAIDSDSKRNEALSNITSTLAGTGYSNRALDFAEAIDTTSTRAEALSNIASALTDSKDAERANKVSQQSLELAQAIDSVSKRAEALSHVTGAFSDTGDTKQAKKVFEQALDAAQAIDGNTKRAETLLLITSVLVESGDDHRAQTAFTQVFDVPGWPTDFSGLSLNEIVRAQSGENVQRVDAAEALSNIASALVYAGEFNWALDVARSINDSDDRADALSEVTITLADTGEFERALDITHTIDSSIERGKALSNIASALADSGDLDRALDVARGIDSDSKRDKSLFKIASALIDSGNLKHALDTVQLINRDSEHAKALSLVASSFAEAGDATRAKKVSEQAFDAVQSVDFIRGAERADALCRIASAFAEARSFEQALDAARSIDSGYDRSRALSEVASTLAEAGRSEKAEFAFDRALNTSRSIDSDVNRADALSEVVSALAGANALDKAFNTARSIDPNAGVRNHRGIALSDLTSALVDSGNFDQALDVARAIDPVAGQLNHRAEALSEVASALAETSDFDLALDVAQAIDSDSTRSETLFDIASALAGTGDFDQALDFAEAIVTNSTRDEALFNIASTLANTDNFDWGLDVTQSIEVNFWCAKALSHMASALSDAGEIGRAKNISEQALDAAQSIDSDSRRARALSYVSSALVDIGEAERAEKVFEQALDAAKETGSSLDSGLEAFGAHERAEALSEMASTLADNGNFVWALDAAREIEEHRTMPSKRDEVLSGLAYDSAQASDLESAIEITLAIADLSERASAVEKIAEQQAKDGRVDAFAEHLPDLKLVHDGWTDFLSTWREALLEHEEDPRPLLRRSLTLYPFDAEAATEGVYSLIQAHIQAGAMDYAEAIAEACPELELDVRAPEPEPPVPEGHDPDSLSPSDKSTYDELVASYQEGDLSDEIFRAKVEMLF